MTKLFKPYVSFRSILNVIRVLLSGQLAEGPEVKKFEKEFEQMCGVRNAVALNSGTSALELAYELAGIKKGDEVIVPVLTCTATNIPLVRRGAKIVFSDITKSLNIDPKDVEKKITKKTKAIIFVHFGGSSENLREIKRIADAHNVILIEDAAQAIGSKEIGKGRFTAVSLQAIKTVTAGDGGILICRDDDDYEKARRLRWFGYDRDMKHKFGDTDLLEAGYKYHMNDVSAAIARGNLRMLPKLIRHQNSLKKIYAQYGIVGELWLARAFTSAKYLRKVKVLAELYGFEVGQHHYRNDKYTLFKKFRSNVPKMDFFTYGLTYYFVPYHYGVSKREAHRIGKAIRQFQDNYGC